ncbi:MAG: nucleotidyltransferase family protein [Gemmatimonadota bacterium]
MGQGQARAGTADHLDIQLVILAAGLGSRYGGMKQLEPVGPGGATLMEYSLYDARRAGFGEAVFVIREDMADAFASFAAGRFGGRIPWRTVAQRLGDVPHGVAVPSERVKPWGTAQAVLAAAGHVRGPFAVLNADDFYDAPSFESLAGFLRSHAGDRPPSYAVVGFRLGDTVPESGGVNRGWCRAGPDGWLESVEEVIGIESAPGGFRGTGESGPRTLPPDALVSMNLWGFTPAVFDTLRRGFVEFFHERDATREEYLIPTAIRSALERGECRVRVLDPGSRWFGVTHPEDRPVVAAAVLQLVREGRYPERLWD